ncbi:Adenylate isopentenyltransferase 1, chloroplastic [Apostasia shenzhenica]|uniref:Adenylate isopentenyltransferase 1, chloroplastic n=1 Tax=Apostasia shenzhenica TaxID=1088818 RepID=A0A2I0BBX2_9ASPA|nr:Adenylate isopentenyltransferase 1, chloroplastic [Apostasia shenzhenica]
MGFSSNSPASISGEELALRRRPFRLDGGSCMRSICPRGIGISRGLQLPTLRGGIEAATSPAAVLRHRGRGKRDGVVVIMGATGTGKSKLSIEVATRIPGEVVNADKIQVYRGLDITTNKMPLPDRREVPHHLLGKIDPAAGELSPAAFRSLAWSAMSGIAARGRLPVVTGGSNSFIHAMLVDRYDPGEDPFAAAPSSAARRLRCPCCLLWVDVEKAVLAEHLDRRVDEMLGMGMLEELERYFACESPDEAERHRGLGKAIGVPEFRGYFRRRTPAAFKEAVAAIKDNTRRLAEEQVRKIERLAQMGWPVNRLDATAAISGGRHSAAAAWQRDVVGPCLCAVERFVEEVEPARQQHLPALN